VSFDNLNRMKLYASYVILVTRIKFRSELSRIVNVPGSFSLVDLSFYAYFIDRHIRINISGAMKESSHYSYICPSSLAARINVKISGRSSSINPKCNEWCEVCARCIPAILITCTSRDVESDVADNNFSNRQFLQRSAPVYSSIRVLQRIYLSSISRIRDEISEVASVFNRECRVSYYLSSPLVELVKFNSINLECSEYHETSYDHRYPKSNPLHLFRYFL